MRRWHVGLGIAALVAGTLLLAAGYRLGRASRSEENMARAARRVVYVVQEYHWRWRHNRAPYLQDEGRPGKPVKAFADRRRADAHCRELNLQKRATVNPFRFMPDAAGSYALEQYTTRGGPAFLALLRAEGLTPPAVPQDGDFDDVAWAWADWWEEHRREWDDEVVERLLNALDRVIFYEVVKVAFEP